MELKLGARDKSLREARLRPSLLPPSKARFPAGFLVLARACPCRIVERPRWVLTRCGDALEQRFFVCVCDSNTSCLLQAEAQVLKLKDDNAAMCQKMRCERDDSWRQGGAARGGEGRGGGRSARDRHRARRAARLG